MANDAYQLQGGNGGVALAAGETFTGVARFVVFDTDGVISGYLGNVERGDTVYAGKSRVAGQTLGGITNVLAMTSGDVTLYGVDSGYTIT